MEIIDADDRDIHLQIFRKFNCYTTLVCRCTTNAPCDNESDVLISHTLYLLRAARLKEEEETKARKEAAAKRMAEAKARAEVSNEYLIPCPTLIIPKLNVAIR